MKYKKFLPVIQLALGVTPANRESMLPNHGHPNTWITLMEEGALPAGSHCRGRRGRHSSHEDDEEEALYATLLSRRSRSLDCASYPRLMAGTMEETIWEQHTVTLNKAPGFGFGIAISGGKDNPHFQSGETSIVISDVLKGGPAEGMLHENDRVVTVNGKHMENVEHAFAVQQLRNSGKTAKITIKRKRRAQPPSSRQPLHEPEAADEIFEAAKEDEGEEEEEEEDDFDRRSARSSRSERSGRSAARRGDRVSAAGGARERGHGHAGERAQSLGRREREASLGRVDRDYGVGRSEQDLTSGRSDRERSAARTDRERSVGRTDREQGVVGRTERDPVLGRTDRDHVLAGTERDRSLGRVERDRGLGQNERERSLGRSEEDRNVMRSERSRGRSMSPGSSDRRSVGSYYQPKLVKVTLVKSKKSEEYGLRLGSQIFVKDVSAEGLAARDGNIHDGDIVLKINGTVTENMSLADARKLIERSKGKLRMVLQRDDQGTLITIPDLEDSIPSSNLSDRDDISEIQSLVSEPSDEAQSRQSSRSRSREDIRSPESETPSRSTGQPSTSSKSGSDPSSKTLSGGAVPTPFKKLEDGPFKGTAVAPQVVTGPEQPDGGGGSSTSTAPPAEPRPTFSRGGQPDVDLPVSPTPALPNSTLQYQGMEMKLVKFRKGESVGLRLAGGNDVGIFVAGVQEGSPASTQGLEEGDQLLKVNNVDFQNIIREEAVLFLLELPKGEEVSILAQRKKDVYRRVVESDVGDSFYIRTHFGYEKETPYGLSFTRGEVFRVVDTLYNGKLGSWLAIRIGRNHQEVERGIIPNKNRAEQLANLQSFAKVAGGDRADFWRFRGLRSVKRNVRKSREDLATQPVQTKFPAYERVVLREAGFLRPVVIFGPIADVARERLARELPDQFEIAKSEPRDAGVDHKRHGMIRLYTIKQIIDRDKHALLDVTPNAVDRLNYAQWYPIVLFLGPDSKAGVKAMRQRLCPESNKSARKLYERSIKLRKSNSHLFTATIQLNYMNDGWYGSLKDTIRQQQNQLVWVSEGKADGSADDDLDMQDDRLSYLSAPGSEYSLFSADSRHASDYDDTDTEGGTYTDQEADEAQHVSAGRQQHLQQQQQPDAAMVRCSEPANPVLRLPEQQAVVAQPGMRVVKPATARSAEPTTHDDEAAIHLQHHQPQQQQQQQPGYVRPQLLPTQPGGHYESVKFIPASVLDPEYVPPPAATSAQLAALGHLHRTSSQPKPPLTLPGLQVLSVRMPIPARPPPLPGVDGAPSSRMSRASSSELQDHSPPPPFHPHPPNPQAAVAAAAHCTQAAMSRASSSEILGDSSPPPVYHPEPAPGTQLRSEESYGKEPTYQEDHSQPSFGFPNVDNKQQYYYKDHNYKPQQPRFDQPPEHIYTIQPSYSYSHQFQKAYSQPSKSHEMQTRRKSWTADAQIANYNPSFSNNSEGHQQSHSYKRQQPENYNVQQPQNYEKQHVNNHHQFNRTPAYETQHAHRQTVDYNSNYHYQSYDLPPNRPYGRDAPGDFEGHTAPPRYSSPIGEEEPPYPPRYDAHGFDGKRAARTPDSQSPRDAPARAHGSRNGPTSRGYGAGGAAPAPSAESHGGHGTLPAARPPPSAHYQRANDGEGGADGPKSKQAKSVMSRIKMFENLDNKARQERLLELQEAQQARVEIAQNFPDIYAVPNKGKQQDGQEQPQAHRTAETQRVSGTRGEGFVPLPRPAHMDGEDVDSARRSLQQCKLPHPVSPTGQTSPTAPTTPSLPDTPKPTHNSKPTYSRFSSQSSSYYSGSGGDVRVSYWSKSVDLPGEDVGPKATEKRTDVPFCGSVQNTGMRAAGSQPTLFVVPAQAKQGQSGQHQGSQQTTNPPSYHYTGMSPREQQAPTSRQEEAPQSSHQGPYRQTSREDTLQSRYGSHRTYAFPQAALPNSGNVPYQPPASAHAKPSQSNDGHYAPPAAAYGKVLAANGGACATTYAVTAAARHPATSNNNSSSGGSSSSNGGSSGNPTRAFAPPFAARFPSGGGYTGAARPFQRRFDSPKFSHNLLPEGAVRAGDGAAAAAVVGVSQAPSQHEFDSGTDTFPRHGDYRPKSHLDGLNATPKAIPVSPSALSEEEGHSVVATARGVFDSNGGVLSSVETGVSVVVPRGAIPEGLEQEIYFKVCQDNSIIPALDKEKGETLLSPLVMCGPHGLRFLKPVELRLPHCAAMNPDGWSFALKSSESITGDPRRWHNMALPGDPNYNIGANSVSVLIDHF
ncbi:tight junction protein ZO-1-like [Lethenteron reissneri]|uniref:tight junction protein ZO-1-like n=1 Tax=Lethenteron reissneri TaxID=7753 RepID=UPI002AB6DD24|nr:tight junction protein ZO-1-like [Lethenteron reissneri]